MECFCRTGANARKTTYALRSNNNNGSLLVFTFCWILCQWEKCFKWAMWYAQITSCTIRLGNRNHGLSHAVSYLFRFLNPSLCSIGQVEMPSPSGRDEGISCPKMKHALNGCKECCVSVVSFCLHSICMAVPKDCTILDPLGVDFDLD